MSAGFTIIGTHLPGERCDPAPGHPESYQQVHVAIQRGKDSIDLKRGGSAEVRWDIDVTIKNGRFAGPYVHGQRGERFIYLVWGEKHGGSLVMFRRAKLQLDSLDAVACDGRTVEGRLRLSDPRGAPLCASVRPPLISWNVI